MKHCQFSRGNIVLFSRLQRSLRGCRISFSLSGAVIPDSPLLKLARWSGVTAEKLSSVLPLILYRWFRRAEGAGLGPFSDPLPGALSAWIMSSGLMAKGTFFVIHAVGIALPASDSAARCFPQRTDFKASDFTGSAMARKTPEYIRYPSPECDVV